MPSTAGTIAEILRDNGYNTFAVGKYGVTPDEEATDAAFMARRARVVLADFGARPLVLAI